MSGFDGGSLAREDLPLRESGGAPLLIGLAIDEVAFQVEVIVDAGVDGGELLQRLHLPEALQCPFSSSEGQV